jgi:hypothetical protein
VVGLFAGAILGTFFGRLGPSATRFVVGTMIAIIAIILVRNIFQVLSRPSSSELEEPFYEEEIYYQEQLGGGR